MEIEKPIILFDGLCNLCNGSVDFVLKRDKKKQFHFVAIQSIEGKSLIKHFNIPEEIDSVILIDRQEYFLESEAAIRIVGMLSFPWKWFRVFTIVPNKIRNKVYRWIARNRYSWFGKRDSCRIV